MEGWTAARSGFPQPIGVWFTHRGNRYLLGHLHDRRGDLRGFGVWDGDRAGPPIERFPVTPNGRDSAVARLLELEADAAIRTTTTHPSAPLRVTDARDRRGGPRDEHPDAVRVRRSVRRRRRKHGSEAVRLHRVPRPV